VTNKAVSTALNKPIGHVSQSTFPLPHTSSLLRQQAEAISSERGFFVLRGLRVDSYTIEENTIIFAGVSSHIASIRGRQDSKLFNGIKQSSMLNHITDLSKTAVASNIGAPAYTTDKQVFHTDAGDIVSLFCLQTAERGGESKLASSWRVYNELAKTRPDLIKTLAENWAFDG
jgi:Taurine catabolism dioxygenase TauD, TfdA family